MNLNKKTGLDFKYKIIIFVFIIILILIVLNLTVNRDKLTSVELFFKGIGNRTQRIFRLSKEEPIEKAPYLFKLENENLKKEIYELKKLLDLKNTFTDYEEIYSAVIHRNVGYWYDTLTIDKGSNDGVKDNMLVMSSNGIIGRTTNVTKYSSDVNLLTATNPNNRITVEIVYNDKSIYGLISGYDYKTNEIIVDNIIDEIKKEKNINVYTSGLTDSYPKGILIGTVTKVEKDEYGLSKIVRLKPSANFKSVKYVIVLKGKEL